MCYPPSPYASTSQKNPTHLCQIQRNCLSLFFHFNFVCVNWLKQCRRRLLRKRNLVLPLYRVICHNHVMKQNIKSQNFVRKHDCS
ncbi:hypothetical protein CGGC5_v010090 [Colletotrichum fructicola Nara gc5]|uniref:Uncharacterized protein n=1 Tax=Colletotrichum fructicola (strain Nara gc5) TaxID=1213859 RepID=A0A7J6IZZ8_COLFN|nr:hypothetical protein CGGC5_v010090 [Colletotrichum fructicola Nara gc5]